MTTTRTVRFWWKRVMRSTHRSFSNIISGGWGIGSYIPYRDWVILHCPNVNPDEADRVIDRALDDVVHRDPSLASAIPYRRGFRGNASIAMHQYNVWPFAERIVELGVRAEVIRADSRLPGFCWQRREECHCVPVTIDSLRADARVAEAQHALEKGKVRISIPSLDADAANLAITRVLEELGAEDPTFTACVPIDPRLSGTGWIMLDRDAARRLADRLEQHGVCPIQNLAIRVYDDAHNFLRDHPSP